MMTFELPKNIIEANHETLSVSLESRLAFMPCSNLSTSVPLFPMFTVFPSRIPVIKSIDFFDALIDNDVVKLVDVTKLDQPTP